MVMRNSDSTKTNSRHIGLSILITMNFLEMMKAYIVIMRRMAKYAFLFMNDYMSQEQVIMVKMSQLTLMSWGWVAVTDS